MMKLDIERAERFLKNTGFEVERTEALFGETTTATIQTAKGELVIHFNETYTLALKPNGKKARYAEITNNQFIARINQLLAYNN